mmetsp:Transcript_9291/g.18946  ORF Transcript_9291/g.18946 Transcript_9291/m.18946 type:complete len:101 (+) Transcript_9291:274-576(+)
MPKTTKMYIVIAGDRKKNSSYRLQGLQYQPTNLFCVQAQVSSSYGDVMRIVKVTNTVCVSRGHLTLSLQAVSSVKWHIFRQSSCRSLSTLPFHHRIIISL